MKKQIIVGAWSNNTYGIKDNEEHWWNIPDNLFAKDKEIIKENMKQLRRDAIIELEVNESGEYLSFEIIEGGFKKITDRDEIVNFETILQKAHERFGSNFSIETALNKMETTWLAKAKVTINEIKFEAHGEATPENVGEHMIKCLPRFAETRAMSRALRLALGEWVPENEERQGAESSEVAGKEENKD